MNDELREAIRARMAIRGFGPIGSGDIATAILALPEVAALRAKAEKWDEAQAIRDAFEPTIPVPVEVMTDLRAKADAADRVRQLAEALEADSARLLAVEWRSDSGRQYADGIREGQVRAAEEIRRALDGDQS